MIKIINEEDKKIAYAVEKVIPEIAKAVDVITERLRNGGRLIYTGAGTSGRLGILDASECPPTFGTPEEMVQGLIAGGTEAIFRAVEDAEDDGEAAVRDLKEINLNEKDVVVGITASGRTPYVIAGIEYANENNIATIGVTTNPTSELEEVANICISPVVGQEALTGSTRMKSGTAQKMVLNILTTGTMIKLGKAYENLMVDVEATNAKLVQRCRRIVMQATGIEQEEAIKYLEKTDNNVKMAIFMVKSGLEKAEAEKVLNENDGYIRKALEAVNA